MNKKNFKIKIFICIVLLFAVIFGIYFCVTKNKNATVEIISNNSAIVGEDFAISLKVNGTEKGLLGIQATMNYDKEIFEIVEKSIEKDGWMITAFNEETGIFMLEITDEDFFNKESYIYDKEEIVEFKFKVNDKFTQKNTNIEILNVKIVDSNYETIEIDSNFNKKINIKNK